MEKDAKLYVNPSKESIHIHQIHEAEEELAGSQANNWWGRKGTEPPAMEFGTF